MGINNNLDQPRPCDSIQSNRDDFEFNLTPSQIPGPSDVNQNFVSTVTIEPGRNIDQTISQQSDCFDFELTQETVFTPTRRSEQLRKKNEWYSKTVQNRTQEEINKKIDNRKKSKKGMENGAFDYEPDHDISKYALLQVGTMNVSVL